jgi:hypothetical protein
MAQYCEERSRYYTLNRGQDPVVKSNYTTDREERKHLMICTSLLIIFETDFEWL